MQLNDLNNDFKDLEPNQFDELHHNLNELQLEFPLEENDGLMQKYTDSEMQEYIKFLKKNGFLFLNFQQQYNLEDEESEIISKTDFNGFNYSRFYKKLEDICTQESESYFEILKKYSDYDDHLELQLKQLIELERIIIKPIEKLYSILDIQFQKVQMQQNAISRIKNELKELHKTTLENIYVFQVQGPQSIFNHYLIIIMKGRIGTPFENGYFSFLLTFPHNFPFAPPHFRTFLPLKHPHIYNTHKLCVPTINEHLKIQDYSLVHLLQTWYAILHREPNKMSIANHEVTEQYNDEFIRQQALFLNINNPLYRVWNLEQLIEENEKFIKI